MQSTIRIGRVGALTIHLHYTWILAAVLELWWVGLLWMPEMFPGRGGIFYWAGAIVVMLLFLASVIAHELMHSAVSRSGPRNANLYPFGAAMPFGTVRPQPGRATVAALAGPAFNLILGFALMGLSNLLHDPAGPAGALQAVMLPLGAINLAVGAINLIPGIPFDGGWALVSIISLFSDDFDTGMRMARSIGGIAALALVLVGAWRGLTSDAWLQALSLVLAGWAARDAANLGQQRGLLRGALDQLNAAQFMDVTRPADVVRASDTVADMVSAHPNYPPGLPLPVLDERENLVGIVTVGAADALLQGTWPNTPVTALMTQIDAVHAVVPDDPLTNVMAIARDTDGTPGEELPIPVISNHKLVGSVDPGRLETFEQVGEVFGIEEATSAAPARRTFLARLGSVLPAVMVIAAMAVLGNIALRTDPEDIKEAMSGVGAGDFTFANRQPEQGSFIGVGGAQVAVDIVADSPVLSVTATLDGDPLDTDLRSAGGLTGTVKAHTGGLTLGGHRIHITAYSESGKSDSAAWDFYVGSRGDAEVTGTEEVSLEVVDYRPALGSRVLAGSDGLELSVRVKASQPPASAKLTLDGKELEAKIAPVEGASDTYILGAIAPALWEGTHRAQALVQQATGGHYAAEWSFTALKPDENNVYFEQTGYFVTQPFLKYWQENGGLAAFGYPISYRLQETAKDSGEVYTAQYFERARFELHPSLGETVVLGRLGALLHEPEPATAAKEGAQFFAETGHNLGGPFLKFWNENGGLSLFGYPISEERVEKNPIDGKEYTVQYFERNRFELHPEFAGTPYEVQLGLLGTQMYADQYGRQQ